MKRRVFLGRWVFLWAAGGMASSLLVPAQAAEPAAARLRKAIRAVTGGAALREGRLSLEIPPIVENGNTVPMTVRVESPMSEADHVKSIHVFNEKNPQPNIGSFYLGPRAGRAQVTTRIRLAGSQTVTAVCQMSDGSWWSGSAQVVVTVAACSEAG
jgi:sulfur-oxidizing protein SoxY